MVYKSDVVLGFRVFKDNLTGNVNLNQKTIINTINAYSYVVAKKDPEFTDALKSSDILLPDGAPIVWASRLLNGKTEMKKIAGYDIFCFLLNELNQQKGSCFFLGSSENTLKIIKTKLKTEYPNIKVGSFSPPYKKIFSEQDNQEMIQNVNSFAPQVLYIGMTAPKQEKWVNIHKNSLNSNIICSIGAVFDFYAGTVKRPDKIWIKLGLEWFIRLIKEPKRLWKRYLVYSPLFFWDLFLGILRLKKY
jgi:N-acetylglucosaminyldiphosphoundecaprenol N-acetyl-beta-D-mannosaminyltransferase